jgi:hypothetical protein
MAYVGYWFRSVAIDVLLSFNFEFVLFSMCFHFSRVVKQIKMRFLYHFGETRKISSSFFFSLVMRIA